MYKYYLILSLLDVMNKFVYGQKLCKNNSYSKKLCKNHSYSQELFRNNLYLIITSSYGNIINLKSMKKLFYIEKCISIIY